MKKNIALVTGGNSSEYEISLQSAQQIKQHIDPDKYNLYEIMIEGMNWRLKSNLMYEIMINKHDFSFSIKKDMLANSELPKPTNKSFSHFNGLPDGYLRIKFDCAFIVIHGTPGEDGKLQAYFEMLNIPYTTTDVLSSSLTFNKYMCNTFLQQFNILCPKNALVRKGEDFSGDEIAEAVGIPCFVKPNNGGSSCGATIVNTKHDLAEAIEKAAELDDEIIIEEYIKGTEITCGMLKTKAKEVIFPLTEIVSKNAFFDYEAKYTPTKADEITPARIAPELAEKCKNISSQIVSKLNCIGLLRLDYIISGDKFYFLEINTIPGMTQNSLVPQQIRAAGIKEADVFSELIEDAIQRKNP